MCLNSLGPFLNLYPQQGHSITKQGLFPGIQYPRVPGWHGGHCGQCESCRRGDFVMCKFARVPGISYDGGYSDYMIAPTVALAEIPKQLSYTEAAPMMCWHYYI